MRERRAGVGIIDSFGTTRSAEAPAMRTIMIFYEVDEVHRWLTSPRRREVFGPLGMTVRTFVDPEQSNRVGMIVEAPSMELFREAIESPRAVDAMKNDGVRPDTLQVLIEG
jgi:hypothetical protein